MKKLFLLLVMLAVIAACNKTEIEDLETQNDLKALQLDVPLYAGQHILAGTVYYTDLENGQFKIEYVLNEGWTMTESHAYVGPLGDLPRQKKIGNPKIGHFPYSNEYDPPGVVYEEYFHTIVNYYDPTIDWKTDFICVAHAVVHHADYPEETAWADGGEAIGDNWSSYLAWGTADPQPMNIVFGIQQNTDGSLGVIYINTNDPGAPEVIFTETVNTSGGEVVAAAFDPNENLLFFVIGNTLYMNDMNTEDPSIVLGTLPGIPGGGAFLNGNFYYIDLDPNSLNFNEIIEVQLFYNETTGSWNMVINDNFSDPYTTAYGTTYQITDMASDGIDIYLVGIDTYGNVDLFVCNVDAASGTGTWNISKTSTQLNGDTQLAFGPDGVLYGVDTDNVGNSQLVSIDLDTGDKDVIDNTIGNSVGDMSDLVTGR